MRRRTLLATGVAGLTTVAIGRPALAGPAKRQLTVALVPLDDRPVNTYAPQMTAASAGAQVQLPPRDLLGRFFTPGDGAAIARWLGTTDHVDGYVISVSMLAYGGLIASRTAAPTLAAALENLASIRSLRSTRPGAVIEVHDTIQRLAITSTGTELDTYRDLLVTWAKLYDQVVNLGQEELRAQLDATRARIPDQVVEDYLAARARNHQVNRLMVEWVADGTISHLVLSEDDTAPVGLARAERVELEALVAQLGVGDRVEIFPGADEVDALLVARVIAARTEPTYRVEYAGVSGEDWTAQLEGIPFAENIRRHVATVGGRVVNGDADIVLAVNTPSSAPGQRAADLDAFVGRIGKLLAAGTPVIVVDPLIVNKADHELVARMENRLDLAALLSYSGWNTGGNALGLALGHGTARWVYLRSSGSGFGVPDLRGPGQAHAEYLLYRFVKDDPWKNIVQVEAYAHARAQGWDPLALTPEQKIYFDGWVSERLVPLTERYFADHFAGHRIVLGRRGAKTFTATLARFESARVELPWDRLFEVVLEPRLRLS
ncbi:DUF4127 family protein [Micromonospora parathelypteridis]|uniref:DUF4127 family protein n=1 Tax=Micromonospora parathelypteridis TaxID=1839617 RepID=A0A840WCG6_9ACTN|nr:DUF4127 family protein [Micromonospora parathelypteridis]MBB5480691.1 hypothetical protein [Micromonospora parathelypteridis]GGO22122.1 hypothetical protein GCM10011576_41110 [Micromonospora parathelypteridis]